MAIVNSEKQTCMHAIMLVQCRLGNESFCTDNTLVIFLPRVDEDVSGKMPSILEVFLKI
jgi:hypothetical protein